MKSRRPGLQDSWAHVVNILQEIIPSYEKASSRISLFADRRLRPGAIEFAVAPDALVLDLGAGPGTMSRLVVKAGGTPVLLDVSRAMLKSSRFENRVQAVFEHLPFRKGVFDSVVSAFALRDSIDLLTALNQVSYVVREGGRFAFCDLGKPDSVVVSALLGCYLRVVPSLIGVVTSGRAGLSYSAIFDTYILTLRNGELRSLLLNFFQDVSLEKRQLGGSIVIRCSK
jgi:ubiquinone/menaquinone biosynthesis C-methylase UbiE